MFLTRGELQEMTGYKRPTAMRRWLAENAFEYAVAADGYPRVLREAVVNRLGARDHSADEWEPSMLRKH